MALCEGNASIPLDSPHKGTGDAESASASWCYHELCLPWQRLRLRKWTIGLKHYSDVMMSTMASQITSITIVYSTVYSGVDQRKHQSSESLGPLWGEFTGHRWIPRTKGQWSGKCFHLMTSSENWHHLLSRPSKCIHKTAMYRIYIRPTLISAYAIREIIWRNDTICLLSTADPD